MLPHTFIILHVPSPKARLASCGAIAFFFNSWRGRNANAARGSLSSEFAITGQYDAGYNRAFMTHILTSMHMDLSAELICPADPAAHKDGSVRSALRNRAIDLPCRSRNIGFETQAPDDLFERRIVAFARDPVSDRPAPPWRRTRRNHRNPERPVHWFASRPSFDATAVRTRSPTRARERAPGGQWIR